MTGASETTCEIKAFFARYSDAFAARNRESLARCFLFPCHFVGDDGDITLTVISSIEQYLAEIISRCSEVVVSLALPVDRYAIFKSAFSRHGCATRRFCGMSSTGRTPCCFHMNPPTRSPWWRATGASARLPTTR